MDKFVELLEVQIPYIFKGASEKLKNQDHIRVTNHKDPVSDETKASFINLPDNCTYDCIYKTIPRPPWKTQKCGVWNMNFTISPRKFSIKNTQTPSKTDKWKAVDTSMKKSMDHMEKLSNNF